LLEVGRRDFLKLAGFGVGAAGITALGFDKAGAETLKQNLRIEGAKEAHSLCPYCAVGCALIAYTKTKADGTSELLQIEGNPDSPINEGRLCPKGATAMQLALSARRVDKPRYRPAGATDWQDITWDDMLDKLAQHIKESRDATFVTTDKKGNTVNRTEGIAFAGGAAFSSEEGYYATKMMRSLGLVHIEQQARL
jgi:formate dehydrogenase major subunit